LILPLGCRPRLGEVWRNAAPGARPFAANVAARRKRPCNITLVMLNEVAGCKSRLVFSGRDHPRTGSRIEFEFNTFAT
ncbi:MAG: hypothetical protein ACRETH_13180, partial [Steroidobacteraceae bacterium]